MGLVFQKQAEPVYDSRVAFFQLLLGVQADGKFGLATEDRVKRFQRENGLAESGRVDEETGRKPGLGLPYWDTKIERKLETPFRDPDKFPNVDHSFPFKAEIETGHFSSRPERFISGDRRTFRAVRTNNPGAINISDWQKRIQGYIGRSQADSAGNKTTIYLTPENGVAAWYELIVVRYERAFQLISGGSTGTTINVERLAKAYGFGGPDKPNEQLNDDERRVMDHYLSGWRKWSGMIFGVNLQTSSEIDPTDPKRMLILGGAMFSHESSFATPLTSAQIVEGIHRRQEGILAEVGNISVPTEPRPSATGPGALTLDAIMDASRVDRGFTVEQDFQMEFNESQQRLRTVLEILKRRDHGEDPRGALEN